MTRSHMSLRCWITTLLLVLGLYGNITHADVIEDANTLFNLAEATYPNFFAPPNQPTQEVSGYVFRYYPATQTYLGVHIANRTVHVLGPIFGPDILTVGSLDDLLEWLESSSDKGPDGEDPGTCVYIPYAVQGTWSQISSYDASGNYTLKYEQLYHTVTDTYAAFSDTLTTPDGDVVSSGESGSWYDSAGNYWYETRHTYSSSVSFTFDVLGETYTDTVTQSEEHVYDSPGLKSPKRFCAGDSWDYPVGCTITLTEDGVVTSTSSQICSTTGRVEAVNVTYTVPAGTFNTVKFVAEDGLVYYRDTETGTLVFRDLGPYGTNVLTAISSGN